MSGGGGGKGGGGSKPVVIGHFYYLTMHMIMCHGPVDKITKIYAGDSTLWTGEVVTTQTININQPNIFGGKLKEGGFVGNVSFEFGYANQQPNPVLAAQTGGNQTPANRGVVGVVWEDVMYSANAARPKPWGIEASRLPKPSFYNVADYSVDGHCNASYLVAECLTNEEWGLGHLESDLDQSYFLTAASSLHSENFKISTVWENATSLEDFITSILQHIDAVLYVDPSTGLFVIKLIRADYDYDTLPVFDEDNILKVVDYSRSSDTELINQITVKWIDEETNEWASLTEHNSAVRELQGSIISVTREYPAIPDQATARKVALRDLSVLSQPLSQVVLEVTREAASLRIGDVFKWNWLDYGIVGMPLRIINVSYGLLSDGRVKLECVEDVYGADNVQFGEPTGTEWVDPNPDPQVASAVATFNATYYDTLTEANNFNTSVSVDKDFGYMVVCAAQPDPVITAYELWSDIYQETLGVDTTDYKFRGGNLFTPYAVLNQSLVQEVQSTISITNGINLEDVRVGTVLVCGSELMELISITQDQTSITVWRGVLDTTPTKVSVGTPIWFYEDYRAYPPLEWVDGTEVASKVLPMTTKGVLPIENATAIRGVVEPRWYKPYPPANLKVNGLSYPTVAVTGDLTVTWAHRDRISQDNVIIHQDEADVGPEPGTTYTVRVMDTAGTVLHTTENIEGNSFTYTQAQSTADLVGDLFHIGVTAVREGVTSTTAHFTAVSRTGAAVPDLPASNDPVVYASHPSFGVYVPSSLALVAKVTITNLEAELSSGEWSSTLFEGSNLSLKWGHNADSVFASSSSHSEEDFANWVKDYQITVKDTADNVLRVAYSSDTTYTYLHIYNTNDGTGGPRRTLKIEVRARNYDDLLSLPAITTFTNPAPAVPAFSLASGTEATYITVVPPVDADLAGFVVYRAQGNSLTPGPGNIVYQGTESYIVIPGNSGQEYAFAVAAYDTFGIAQITPSAVYTDSLLSSNVDIWTFIGLDFRSNHPATNKVSWSAGSAFKNSGTEQAISAGEVTWTSGVLFIYYDGVSNSLSATTDLAVAISGASVLATYKGGTELTVGNGKALFDGSLLLAGSVGANHLVADSAVITNTLQVQSGILTDAHIQNLQASKIIANDLSVISQNVGVVTAGVLKSADDQFVIDLNNKSITIL